jgi:hypothetical protein
MVVAEDDFGSVEKSIEHGPRHSDALIAVVSASQLMKVGVGIMGDARQLVKKLRRSGSSCRPVEAALPTDLMEASQPC